MPFPHPRHGQIRSKPCRYSLYMARLGPARPPSPIAAGPHCLPLHGWLRARPPLLLGWGQVMPPPALWPGKASFPHMAELGLGCPPLLSVELGGALLQASWTLDWDYQPDLAMDGLGTTDPACQAKRLSTTALDHSSSALILALISKPMWYKTVTRKQEHQF